MAVRSAMRQKRISYRDLARKTRELDPEGKGLSHGYIASLGRGEEEHPSRRAMALLAQSLGLEVEEFAEWQLLEARSMLDESHVGLETALSNLGHFTRMLASISEQAEGLRPQASAASQTPLSPGTRSRGGGTSKTHVSW